MPAYYQSGLAAFLRESPSTILWKLAQANAAARFPLTSQAIEAWHAQLPFLTTGFSELLRDHPAAKGWSVLLEYPIPIVGKRIDAVLIAHNLIVVIDSRNNMIFLDKMLRIVYSNNLREEICSVLVDGTSLVVGFQEGVVKEYRKGPIDYIELIHGK